MVLDFVWSPKLPKIRLKVLDMVQGFILDGKPVDDSILYYWSVVAISRALRFRAEACQQLVAPRTNGYVSAAWAVYYSMFHLGVFVAFSSPDCLGDDARKRMRGHDSHALYQGLTFRGCGRRCLSGHFCWCFLCTKKEECEENNGSRVFCTVT